VWPRAEPIRTRRLTLEPLSVAHAAEMVAVLADQGLYAWTGGEAPTEEELTTRYRLQSAGESPDGSSGWLNWVVRETATGQATGFVQATLTGDEELVADVAWVVGVEHQGNGIATEAAGAMVAWLADRGTVTVQADIHPDNAGSDAVARRLGLTPTATVVDGEIRWQTGVGPRD